MHDELDLSSYLDRVLPCAGCGRTHGVETKACVVAPDAPERHLPAFLTGTLDAGRVLLIWDETTRAVAGERVRDALSSAGMDATTSHCLAPDAHGPPCCDAATVDLAALAVRKQLPDVVVAVGSGTVNDVAKAASGRAGVPYVVVPTAASMNGYTSAIAAVLDAGVKTTVSFPATAGVFADPEVVAAAPVAMTRAGLGDLLSKSVCGADWRVSHVLEDAWWCELPGELVARAEEACLVDAAALGAGDPAAVGRLVQALLLSGISMAVAGSSSPASGGEHLFSHLMDMRRHAQGRAVELHGAQVGVGTLAMAALYEALLDYPVEREVDPARLAAEHPAWEAEEQRIRRVHGDLAGEILGHYQAKYRERDAHHAFVARLVARWPEVRQEAGATVRPLAQLRGALEAAGAPVRAAELGLGADEAREVFLLARDIRARYTVLDLAWDLGLLDELAGPALAASGILES